MIQDKEQGKGYFQIRRGLPNVARKLAGVDPFVVAFIGGSITEGYGASEPDETSWRALTGNYLKKRYPQGMVICINAGVGGTTSTFGAHRMAQHVMANGEIDLLFVEFSVNDGEDREESIRGVEGIVRQCRRLSPHADICLVYTAADKNLSVDSPFNIAVHEEVASHYELPSINLAAGIRALIQKGEIRWEELAPDLVHPNDAGYAQYAVYVQAFLEEVLALPVSSSLSTMMLPTPLMEGNYEFGAMLDINHVEQQNDFKITEVKPEPLINWRYGLEHLSTDKPDSQFSFIASGRSSGLLLLCGPDTGIFEYSLDGLTFHAVNLFDEWCLGAYRPIIAVFQLQPDVVSTRVIVRNTAQKDERSKGTGLRVLKLLSS
ncbi:SGNH/GDSL hydrolase family protein [Paenibacillus paridis]|uniref:SGNH/GDSL hydrolase family protein n=1 Tax=Paenibacillus paridis TaxID=2583376 RepID=UPI00111F9A22|nr:SGNH/GDSL hydrolase family protein [Paenibacillus paridis]